MGGEIRSAGMSAIGVHSDMCCTCVYVSMHTCVLVCLQYIYGRVHSSVVCLIVNTDDAGTT